MSDNNNLQILTNSHKVIAAKKKKKNQQINQILFDDDSRRDFLTGFHKRKLAKAEAAKQKAKDREKQERQQSRREQRAALRERAEENAREVESAYGAIILPHNIGEEDEEEWDGITNSLNGTRKPSKTGGKGKSRGQKDEEFEDEETLATVTVVEDFDPDEFIHGPRDQIKAESESASASQDEGKEVDEGDKNSRVQSRKNGNTHKSTSKEKHVPTNLSKNNQARTVQKKKTSNIRYETKAARKAQSVKQRARRAEKAELAGGKGARKRSNRNSKGRGKRG